MAGNAWEHFERRGDLPIKVEQALRVRIFGPYDGRFYDMLKNITHSLQNDSLDVKICEEDEDIPTLEPMTGLEKGKPIYNLYASLECVRRADIGVFVFPEVRPYRFPKYLRRAKSKRGRLPQDLNSSVVLELSKWIGSRSSLDDCFVVYENGTSKKIGSLIGGEVMDGEIESWTLNTNQGRSLEEQLVEKIKGEYAGWVDRHSDRLVGRI